MVVSVYRLVWIWNSPQFPTQLRNGQCSIPKIGSLQRGKRIFLIVSAFLASTCYHWHTGMYVVKDLMFHFKRRAGHYTLPIDDYVKPKGTRLTRHSSDQDVLIAKCRTKLFQFSYFNRIAKTHWNALLLLISLNLTYSNDIRLLFVQTMTSLLMF